MVKKGLGHKFLNLITALPVILIECIPFVVPE